MFFFASKSQDTQFPLSFQFRIHHHGTHSVIQLRPGSGGWIQGHISIFPWQYRIQQILGSGRLAGHTTDEPLDLWKVCIYSSLFMKEILLDA